MIEKIRAARRAGRVARFHTHHVIHSEDVAQHTFNVMNLLLVLTHGNVSHNLLLAALMHDQGEYLTGDIPSPVKQNMDDRTKNHIGALEQEGVNFIHHRGAPELTEWEHKLLKLADNLDGYIKCCEEVRRGNVDMLDCRRTYGAYLSKQVTEVGGNIATTVESIIKEYFYE